ncbi:alpha/beta hydrolase [Microbacterium sp. BWT-B31]|uniref:alpha/beta fold hydrolase n=1 Tax=Microbacterium sp. BWT-B31 TaxID=3232072 RepID=UPI0035275606
MPSATSADGTLIAYHRYGEGPPVIIVNGAFSTAADAEPIADAFASAGLGAVTYDRRARHDSGDTRPYAPEREAEDLAAVIEAVGGAAAVLGHSSGAVVAWVAASVGVPVTRLFLSEPPLHFGQDEPAEDLPERLQAFVDEARPEQAVVTFQREGIGLPEQLIEQLRNTPMFAGLLPLAQSTVYDATLTRAVSTPTAQMRAVGVPVTVLCGVETFPFLIAASRRVAESIPGAELIEVPESVGHRVDPEATVRLVADRLRTPA